MKRHHIATAFQCRSKSTPTGAEDAGGMGFIDNQKTTMPFGKIGKRRERRAIAIHGIKALGSDPWSPLTARLPPADYFPLECLDLIMRHSHRLGLSRRNAIMHAGMDKGIM